MRRLQAHQSWGLTGLGMSQELLEMPGIARPAIGLTGHLPAAKASEVIEAGKGRRRRERR